MFEAVDHLLSDSGHAARVAVKLIAVDDFTVHRQAAEATKARRIEHPGVARVLDRGLAESGELFLVYELVAGGDLQAWFEARERRADLRVVARMVADIARGVQAAHSVGVVHCDLKPSNVLVTPEGQARVTDFGVAAITDAGAAGGSASGSIPLGNLAFAAPEQIRQSMASASPLVDVYALGGLLFYLATGEFPNGQTAEEVLRAHDSESARAAGASIRSRRPDADARLDRICARSMAARPEDRYATAAEVAADLDAWLHNRPIAWMQERLPARFGLWMKRSPVAAALLIICLVVVVGGSFLSGFYAHQAQVARAKGAELELGRDETSRLLLAMSAWLDIEKKSGKSPTRAQALKEIERLIGKTRAADGPADAQTPESSR